MALYTYKSQSTAKSKDTSPVGNPRAVRTNSMVIRAELGIEAAPMLARVAVMLIERELVNLCPLKIGVRIARYVPDNDYITRTQRDSIHLRDEDRSHRLV